MPLSITHLLSPPLRPLRSLRTETVTTFTCIDAVFFQKCFRILYHLRHFASSSKDAISFGSASEFQIFTINKGYFIWRHESISDRKLKLTFLPSYGLRLAPEPSGWVTLAKPPRQPEVGSSAGAPPCRWKWGEGVGAGTRRQRSQDFLQSVIHTKNRKLIGFGPLFSWKWGIIPRTLKNGGTRPSFPPVAEPLVPVSDPGFGQGRGQPTKEGPSSCDGIPRDLRAREDHLRLQTLRGPIMSSEGPFWLLRESLRTPRGPPYELRGSLRRPLNPFRVHQSTCWRLQTTPSGILRVPLGAERAPPRAQGRAMAPWPPLWIRQCLVLRFRRYRIREKRLINPR